MERWGIDLGGTKIEGIVMSQDGSEVLARVRQPTEQQRGYDHIVGQIAKVVDLLTSETGLQPSIIGMGTPGTTDPESLLLKNSNTVVLNGMPLKKSVEKKVRVPFIFANDANCFAMAETHLGVVRDLGYIPEVVVGLILGTGVGSGIVVRGEQITGLHGIGGEWGHNTLIPDGKPCYCGKLGCVEKVIAGPALESFYATLTSYNRPLKEIVKRSRSGVDQHASETLERLYKYFGLAISSIINVLDPEVIVIGGGVGNIDELYKRGRDASVPHIFNRDLNTKFLKPTLGDSAGVFGAAMLT